jgi:hypothetical protein
MLVETFRRTLNALVVEPGPMTVEKAQLIEYLLNRIAQHDSLDRSTGQSQTG